MSKHKKLTILLLMLLSLQQIIFATLNLTEEEQSYIAERGPVRAVSIDGAAPIQYIDSKGEYQGISLRVLQEIGNRTGLIFTATLYDKIEDAKVVYSDDTEILFGIPDQYIPPEYTVSSPYLQSQAILFANKQVKPMELKGKRFAATLPSALPEGITEDQAIYYKSREEAIKAVNKGEADFGYGNAYSVAFYTLQYGFRDIYTVPQKKEDRLYRIVFIEDDPILVSIIDKALASITPQEMQTIILETTSQVERIITPSMILELYGNRIFFISFGIIAILLGALVVIQKSRVTLGFEKKKFRTIAEVSNEYLFEYDAHHKTVIPYERFNSLFTTPESLQEAKGKLVSLMASQQTEGENSVMEVQMPDGNRASFRASFSRVPGQKGHKKTLIGKLMDISEDVARENYLQNLAQTDGLTRLLNAAATRSHIEKRLRDKKSSDSDFCILFDLDSFKSVNDTMGHLAGNKVLEALGSLLLQGESPTDDIIGRVGGDEFCIYLVSAIGEEEALAYCTSLLEAVRFKFREERVTISMGMAKVVENDTYETLYARVDHAMYKAKVAGKNRVEIAKGHTKERLR